MKRSLKISAAVALIMLLGCLTPRSLIAGSQAGNDSSQETSQETHQKTSGENAKKATKIEWLSFADGKAAAAQTGRPMLVNFTASWCIYCKKMKKETYSDAAVIEYVGEHYIPVRVDTQKEPKLAAEYYVRSIPIIWFLGATGQRITSLPGYVDPQNFLLVLAFIATESYNSMDFETFVKTRGNES